ncbi:hypothetical protein NW759_016027 [Fusarium solani]|nr:hypothetical protein NW759_016027 [Fusarium solani]
MLSTREACHGKSASRCRGRSPPRQDIHIHIAPKDATERANLIESLWTPIDDTPSKSHPIHPRFKSPTWQHRDYLTALLTRPCKGIHSSTLIILFSFFFFFSPPPPSHPISFIPTSLCQC